MKVGLSPERGGWAAVAPGGHPPRRVMGRAPSEWAAVVPQMPLLRRRSLVLDWWAVPLNHSQL